MKIMWQRNRNEQAENLHNPGALKRHKSVCFTLIRLIFCLENGEFVERESYSRLWEQKAIKEGAFAAISKESGPNRAVLSR